MKKALAILLAALLLLSAQAEDLNNLSWKLGEQLRNGSGLKLTVTFDDIQALPNLFDQTVQAALQNLLSGATVQVNRLNVAFGAQKGRAETAVTVKRGDKTLLSAQYLSDGAVETFTSSLLGTAVYGAAKGENIAAALLASAAMGTAAAGTAGTAGALAAAGAERAILSVLTADNEWRAKAAAIVAPYTQDLSAWMQGYTAVSNEQQADGSLRTVTSLTLPASEVKAKLLSLMDRFYSDEQLLALLKERFSAREAALYLNPEMKDSLKAAVTALPLEGEVKIARVFGKNGVLVSDSISLPMGGAEGLSLFAYEASTDALGVTSTAITLTGAEGAAVQKRALAFKRAENGPASGTYATTVNGSEVVYGFEYAEEVPAPTVDLAKGLTTQPFAYTLRVTPQSGIQQTVSVAGTLSSGSNSRSATKIEATLDWTDDEGAKAHAAVSGGSAAPWSVPALPANVLRVDSLDSLALQAELQSIAANLQASLIGLSGVLTLPSLSQ